MPQPVVGIQLSVELVDLVTADRPHHQTSNTLLGTQDFYQPPAQKASNAASTR
jgi:hypothetical protein